VNEEGHVIELSLGKNKLNGQIPDLSAFMYLEKLNLRDNRLNGEIPVSLALLPHLKSLRASNNSLSGTIPGCDLENAFPCLEYFHVQRNRLSGVVPSILLEGKVGLDLRLQPGNESLETNSLSFTVPQFPMHLMASEDLTTLCRIPAHEDAKSAGLLANIDVSMEAYQLYRLVNPGMRGVKTRTYNNVRREEILFVSHRWLTPDMRGGRHAHVDCDKNSKLGHLQHFLLDHPEIKWVWMDYFSCPQIDAHLQSLCINSIAFYIHSSGQFYAFAAHHDQTDDRHDFRTYLRGGWPRFEMLVASCPFYCQVNKEWKQASPRSSLWNGGKRLEEDLAVGSLDLEPTRDIFFDERDFERIQPVLDMIRGRLSERLTALGS